MRSFTIAAAAALISSAYASPWTMGGLWGGKFDPAKCLTQPSVDTLVTGFGQLISNYTDALAETILADNLTDFSDSINSLIGQPVGGATFPSKAAFEAGQGSQPPVPFQLIAIEAYNCDTISLRWIAGLQPQPVKGITVLKASNSQGQKDTWQISTIYTEFNSIAWLEDIGGNVTYPSH
ncbi:hypothetical protein AYL99_07204 [Fonsecaea erecta]|uniref:NTF2-like domain-containing protein n=1 Tax=Fonsecaea erecta TaxID=1367422 RepID=A0A178ZE79_9EURO|nr:hypothetical protein AYL99_07204 [Fonsecaea erecta]OAP58114.1 hypothetical protein AYL99_07204 [Fonsecaea erecta]